MRSRFDRSKIAVALCVTSIAVTIVSGCVSTSGGGAERSVRETDAKHAEGCEFLGSIFESVTAGLAFGSMAQQQARDRVLDEAEDRGATHVVWTSQGGGGMTQSASANAYRCDPPAAAPQEEPEPEGAW